MAANRATPLHPLKVVYKNHTITLTHRPSVNDWEYTFQHTRTFSVVNHAPRYDTALKNARRDIDAFADD